MPPQQPPPLHSWESLRCGAEGVGGSVQLVRATAWERYGEARLASLYAGLQLKFHRPDTFGTQSAQAAAAANGSSAAAAAAGAAADGASAAAPARSGAGGSLGLGQEFVLRPSMTDRVLAACKLAGLTFAQGGEHAALTTLLALRARCAAPPLRAIWLQHTCDVLLRGALLRGERRRAAELLHQQQAALAATDGPSDATWEAELELLLQVRHLPASPHISPYLPTSPRAQVLLNTLLTHASLLFQSGERLEVLLQADERGRKPATCVRPSS